MEQMIVTDVSLYGPLVSGFDLTRMWYVRLGDYGMGYWQPETLLRAGKVWVRNQSLCAVGGWVSLSTRVSSYSQKYAH